MNAIRVSYVFAMISSLGVAPLCIGGPLEPPIGPVAPNFKTLQEVEPRMAVDSLPSVNQGGALYAHHISQSGSYYLTGDLTAPPGHLAIAITAPNVFLDLNGFTVQGPAIDPGFADALILITGAQVTITNGTVKGSFTDGLFAPGGSCVISNIAASENAGAGIGAEDGAMVIECTATNNGIAGIVLENSRAVRCSASENPVGFSLEGSSAVEHAIARSNHHGFVLTHSIARFCESIENELVGFNLIDSAARESTAMGNTHGFELHGQSDARNNVARLNTVGIFIQDGKSSVIGNFLHFNGVVSTNAGGHVIVQNVVTGASKAPFDLQGDNFVGQIVTSPAEMATAGPWANFVN